MLTALEAGTLELSNSGHLHVAVLFHEEMQPLCNGFPAVSSPENKWNRYIKIKNKNKHTRINIRNICLVQNVVLQRVNQNKQKPDDDNVK